MRFVVLPNGQQPPQEGRNTGYLLTDNWDDWFKYSTMYFLTYFDATGNRHDFGSIKIGQFLMNEGQRRPDIPGGFEALTDAFFSLGQDADYYSAISLLPDEVAARILSALRDVAADQTLYQRAINENVMGESLLRFVNMRTVEVQFPRIISGGAELTDYSFSYTGPTSTIEGIEPLGLTFNVTPDSTPPTNIHVVIGRNGVGKTHLLNGMTRALVSDEVNDNQDGFFTSIGGFGIPVRISPFANIVSVTFSAFDESQIIKQSRNATQSIRYTNVGLRKRIKDKKNEWVSITRDPEDLAKEFASSAKLCARGSKAKRWRQALHTLEADPLFAEAEVSGLADETEENFGRAAGKLYRRLSSGHKIVLLTITKLVETVEERTLVMMDEPEAHLHPPLLSACIRAVSDLLVNRNGVAIIATHSPVVVQEVPRSCVWKVIRHGHASQAARPEIETFAETVGILTHEIFGLEVTRSGFHKMLAEAIGDSTTINQVVAKFDNEVGSEGRALISALLAEGRREDI